MDPFIRIIAATLLLGVAWFLVRRYSTRARGDSRRQVQVLARLGLARGVSVAVVRVAGKGFLLGLSDKGVSLVAQLDPEDLEALAVAPEELPEAPTVHAPAAPADVPDALHALLHQPLLQQAGSSIPLSPRMGLVQRLRRMTLRTNPVGYGSA